MELYMICHTWTFKCTFRKIHLACVAVFYLGFFFFFPPLFLKPSGKIPDIELSAKVCALSGQNKVSTSKTFCLLAFTDVPSI